LLVTNRSLAQPPPPTTRFERGIALAEERFEEITRVAPWIWSVPSCSGPGVHDVNLKTGECSCPDRTPAGETDKHVTAARYKKAKTALCSGCSERFRHRDLYEVGEDNLTFFEGDLVCIGCAVDHGVGTL
jgi:hypothetical protein